MLCQAPPHRQAVRIRSKLDPGLTSGHKACKSQEPWWQRPAHMQTEVGSGTHGREVTMSTMQGTRAVKRDLAGVSTYTSSEVTQSCSQVVKKASVGHVPSHGGWPQPGAPTGLGNSRQSGDRLGLWDWGCGGHVWPADSPGGCWQMSSQGGCWGPGCTGWDPWGCLG